VPSRQGSEFFREAGLVTERATGQRLSDVGDVAMAEDSETSFNESVLSREEDDNTRFEYGRKLDESTFYSSSP
jgi:hypothetical protein